METDAQVDWSNTRIIYSFSQQNLSTIARHFCVIQAARDEVLREVHFKLSQTEFFQSNTSKFKKPWAKGKKIQWVYTDPPPKQRSFLQYFKIRRI